MSKLISILGLSGVFFAAAGVPLMMCRSSDRDPRRPAVDVGTEVFAGSAAEESSNAKRSPDRVPIDEQVDRDRTTAKEVGAWIGQLRNARARGDEGECRVARSGIAQLGLAATGDALLSLLANEGRLRTDMSTILREIGDDSIAQRLLRDLGDVTEQDLITAEVDLIVALARSDESSQACMLA